MLAPLSNRSPDRPCDRHSSDGGWLVADDLLDLFLSATEDYGIILLDPDGRVQRWSRGAERLFGYAAHELEGSTADRIFVPPDRQAGVPDIELQMAAEQGDLVEVIRLIREAR